MTRYEKALRALGEGPSVGLVHHLQGTGEADRLAAMEVSAALDYLWPAQGTPGTNRLTPTPEAAAAFAFVGNQQQPRPAGRRLFAMLSSEVYRAG